MDLFLAFLKATGSAAYSWAVGRVLDVMIACPTCGQRDATRIGNLQSNWLSCSNCHRMLSQYTNACDFTVNRYNSQIAHAVFAPGNHSWEWATSGKFLDFEKKWIRVPFHIRVDGLQGRSVVLETEMKCYQCNETVSSHRSLLHPSYPTSIWNDYWHSVHADNIEPKHRGLITVDARIVSEYRDILFEDKRIIQPWQST